MTRLRKLFEISILKTLYLNYIYFGINGLAHPYIIVSRNTKIASAKGKIIVNNPKRFCVRIGFQGLDIFDSKRQNSIFSNNGIIEFSGYCHLGSGARISNSGILTFGENFNITANSTIICHDKVSFGNDVLCSWNCMIIDTDFHHIDDNINHKPINIGNKVWICQDVTILKGVSIPDGCVVAANTVVHKTIKESNSLIACNSEIIKRNVKWSR